MKRLIVVALLAIMVTTFAAKGVSADYAGPTLSNGCDTQYAGYMRFHLNPDGSYTYFEGGWATEVVCTTPNGGIYVSQLGYNDVAIGGGSY